MDTESKPRRQFVACKFRIPDTRTFTYHWDGGPLQPGDKVKVPDPKGADGWKRVYVVSTSWDAPKFPTKEILGLAPDEPIKGAAKGGEPLEDRLPMGDGMRHKPDLFGGVS